MRKILKNYHSFKLTAFNYTYDTTRFENILKKFKDINNLRNIDHEWSIEAFLDNYRNDVICSYDGFYKFLSNFNKTI